MVFVGLTIIATGQVGINSNNNQPDPSAMLDVSATNRGVLIPRLSTVSRNLIPSPATGLLIYNTTTSHFNYYNGNSWYQIEKAFISSTVGTLSAGGGVSINASANVPPDNSAMLDVNNPTRGVLVPATIPDSIASPAVGLIIYNTATNLLNYFNGTVWVTLCAISSGVAGAGGTQSPIGVAIKQDNSGPHHSAMLDVAASNKGVLIPRLTNAQRNAILPVNGLVIYNSTTNEIEFYNGAEWSRLMTNIVAAPAAGIHVPATTQISWNWSPVSGATGYKWNTANNYSGATDVGNNTVKVETGLTCNTGYNRYVWAYNFCGNSPATTLDQSTSACSLFPEVFTTPVTEIILSSATSGGNIIYSGGSNVSFRGICWATTPSPTFSNFYTFNGGGIGTYVSNMTGLAENTLYYVRAYAMNGNGTSYGNELTFITATTVTTSPVSNITQTTAISGGNVSPGGGAPLIAKGVCWSTIANPTIADSHSDDGTGTGFFFSNITGLSANTTYYARAYATNISGTSYGNQQSFTTSPALAIVLTSDASNVLLTTATCGGNVTSSGGASVTVRGVCWSTVANPTTANPKTTDGSGTGSFTSSLTGLTANTLYYVRAYATSTAGTAYGNEITFTTLLNPLPPTVATAAITNITSSSATGGGNVSSDGGAMAFFRGICWGTTPNPTIADDHTFDGNGTGSFVSSIIGLTQNTLYYVRAYAVNPAGTAYGNEISFTTLPTCGTITVYHAAGLVAPVSKTVTYATTTNIPGEPVKCWITSNLGSDHQATAVSDATEASAGWYWQFNRKQGYKHDGTTVSPSWPIDYIFESSDWIAANDACSLELGGGWRIPTSTEYDNIVNANYWFTWAGPWNSTLKLHAAGILGYSNGTLSYRGTNGSYWSSTQNDATFGRYLSLSNQNCYTANNFKAIGEPLRCIKNANTAPIAPTVNTASVVGITQSTATTGGTVVNDGGADVTARGVCWSNIPNPSIATNHTTNGTGVGVFVSNLTGLTPNTLYYLRAYAINSAGTSYGNEISFTTLPVWTCGASFTVNHVAGAVAPFTKTTTYGTVNNIPGELLKCWITSNLGADHQATSVTDATEASAGWYWQFNRKQGYKHDGTNRTPSTTWISSIAENFDWQATNDPCATELGNGWRVPAYTEWNNVSTAGNWTTWNGYWSSGLKMHASGYLDNYSGVIYERGVSGEFWSSAQFNTGSSYFQFLSSSAVGGNSIDKTYGFSLRCIKDFPNAALPTITTKTVTNIGPGIATSGGIVSDDGGSFVTTKGVCWSTTSNPTTANSHTVDGSGIGGFVSDITGLISNSQYYVRAYATNNAGTVYGNETMFTTFGPLGNCGSLIINHLAGAVAPVTKTVTYSTVSNIPGEPLKCWLASNLGADHQAPAVYDDSEASAGWYWQFNRKQGFKHDGTTRTPNTTWIYPILENIDWQAANDPCVLELGNGWRIPTYVEWTNVDATGIWADWNGPWNSGLKLHATGMLYYNDGGLSYRGTDGYFWSMQTDAFSGRFMYLSSSYTGLSGSSKDAGFSLRCIKDSPNPMLPTVTTSPVSNIGQTAVSSGGNVTSDGGALITAQGVCWGISSNPTIAGNHTDDGSGGGVFTSNLSGLTANTSYFIRAYATNSVGTVYGSNVAFSTTAPAVSCGSLTINHVAGTVAPVSKTVTYGTVINIPGEPTKCWITSNLGADHQATSVDDPTEPSAGWYWQFNRKQGFKHDGTTRTPNSTWITTVNENLDWQSINDACASELGSGWRIPTYAEWYNVNSTGNWTSWNGSWNSGLKLHASGSIYYVDGSLVDRGYYGKYWGNAQNSATQGWRLVTGYNFSYLDTPNKANGYSLRCIMDTCTSRSTTGVSITPGANPVCAGDSVTFTATPSNGGAFPYYMWKKNRAVVKLNSPVYTCLPENGDSVWCVMTSSVVCATNPATSNKVKVTVSPIMPVSVAIAASQNPVCTGNSVTFTATPVNGGTNPVYQWKVNGILVASSSQAYTYVPANGDSIRCILISGAPCDGIPATSNKISMIVNTTIPVAPVAGIHVPSLTQIIWNWSPVSGATGYKWSSVNDYATATDMGTLTAKTETGLVYSTPYTRYAWAYNGCGNSVPVTLNQATAIFTCGTSITINHAAGIVAPVIKTVTYGTVTGIPGVNSKCWITSNLGADHQATSVSDATEPSAGWYWQFNRKQGYKHDGTTRTPNTTWISTITETSDWIATNDPCTLELGTGWRIPTNAEWTNVDASGNWTTRNGPWGSGLKLHAAGQLVNTTGSPYGRGSLGYYWSSTQNDATSSGYLYFSSSASTMYNTAKPFGFTIRCLRDTCASYSNVGVSISPSTNPVCAGTSVTFTATPTNGGSSPAYQWKKNSTVITGATNVTYTYVPLNNDALTCALTTAAACVAGSPATSNTVAMTVNPVLSVSVSIAASANPVCAGTSVTFTATPANGGTTPVYQWKVNGVVVGTNSPTYSYIPANGDSIRCVLISSDPCAANTAISNKVTMIVSLSIPVAPVAGNHVPSLTQIIWNWNTVTGALGYKWNTVNDYASATDMGNATSKMETGLAYGTQYTRYVWAYSGCGNSTPVTFTQSTTAFNCGISITINHIAGIVAPVAKTVMYGTVTGIPGVMSKCWITSNLGADHQATAVDDATEPSAGWYWQFNRKQGYKHTGSAVNPSWTLTNIYESSDWQTANDPCNLELNGGWRIPTYTEWYNVDNTGGWANWNGPWNSGLKLHAAGYLIYSNGSLYNRGADGYYWGSMQSSADYGQELKFSSGVCNMGNMTKAYGLPLRCLRDTCSTYSNVGVFVSSSTNPVCAGATITFTAIPTNAGTTPAYQWEKNGMVITGATNVTYAYVPVNNDALTCVLTTNAACVTGNPATSNTVTMTVNPGLTASVSIAASANPVCAGSAVTFTAIPTNGGASPAYQWKKNATVITGATNVTYAYIPVNNDALTCVLASTAACATGSPATSNTITMTVIPTTASVSIVASANPVCTGSAVTFTAAPTNGGTTPVYQWKVNGVNVGTNSPTYSYIPANGDSIRCVLTSSEQCAANTAISNKVTMMVIFSMPGAPVAGNHVASANQIIWIWHPVNGATGYKWGLSNDPSIAVVIGSDTTKTETGLTCNTAYIRYVWAYNSCGNSTPVTLNQTTSACGVPCPGTPVVSHGGQTYNTVQIGSQCWFKENLNIGTRINGALEQTNNSIIEKYCYNDLESNCAIYGGLYQWNEMMQYITIAGVQGICPFGWHIPTDAEWCTVTQFLDPTVNCDVWGSIGTNAGGKMKTTGTVESGTGLWNSPNTGATNESGFSSVPAGYRYNDGTFSWVGGQGWLWSSTEYTVTESYYRRTTYSSSKVERSTRNKSYYGTSVRCLKDTCSSYSNVGISISPSANPACAGTSVTFTATPSNGGATPAYQWKKNGTVITGATNAIYSYVPVNNDALTCVLTTYAACVTGSPATSNTVTMTVNPVVVASVSIAASANPGCAGTSVTFTATPTNGGMMPSYQWKVNGANVGTNVPSYSYIPANGDSIRCVLTSGLLCATNSAISNKISMTVSIMLPVTPVAGTQVATGNQIVWNWNPVSGALGYKWSAVNDFAAAADMGTATTKTETGLAFGTPYSRYVWAYNGCGNSVPLTITQNTTTFSCGNPILINHIAGAVSPVAKTVTYGTVTNIPGVTSKCWITSNLGADHQATAKNDATEASAGWCWQFNRKQGYKHDGTTRTPNTTWISSISETTDWLIVNDPCTSELGAGWRIPTNTEWTNVDASGNWTTWNGPWGSMLKIHAAGNVSNTAGSLGGRGVTGTYWSSVNSSLTSSWYLILNSASSQVGGNDKAYGFSIRCIRDTCASYSNVGITISPSTNPVCAGTSVTFTATPSNGGATPAYLWKKNSTVINGATNVTYTYVPVNNDALTCVLTTNAACVTGSPATSNTVIMTANPVLTASVIIAASANPVCAGTSVTFTATPTNGGATPIFQWKVNGVNVGTNIPTYSYIPMNGDSIWCVFTSSEACVANTAISNKVTLMVSASIPAMPVSGIHIPGETQIIWNWNPVSGAFGYKWNAVNDFAAATDMGTATTKTETGLAFSTSYTRYVWAYNCCGNSVPVTLSQTTIEICGTSLTINHIAGIVAPVTKTVVYSTVANIPGATSKCWITSNLGSDHQATALNDATEASAGWYWQFNRKQGYKHDGTTRTPNTTWITSIIEISDWVTANDPCNLQLGIVWRIPTYTEWYNVDNIGGWTNWNGPWGSGLKLHASGSLSYNSGLLLYRGSYGYYWSSTPYSTEYGWNLVFNSGNSGMQNNGKAFGFSVRCLRD